MATTPIPLRQPGVAAFEAGDTYVPVELFNSAIPHPLSEDFAYGENTVLGAYSVVGVTAAGLLALAIHGDAAAVSATGALTFSGVGTAADTVTIGARVYTLAAAAGAANTVKIGATAAETAANLIAAINAAAGAGVTYGAGTLAHADVLARANSDTVVGIVAKVPGTAGNAIATTEAGTGTAFGAATLAGGLAAAGIDPIGVLITAIASGAGETGRAPIWRAGNFNPAALTWHASFDTDAKKAAAFRGSPAPTNIVIRARL
ncbi:hypothetical protein V5F41_12350 [Xanthobacter autotrophicus]|uniref:hypothetical protein n=1 Tax=Xanthobacter autotrophicus TaxID=280 RepID=UPI00372A86B5